MKPENPFSPGSPCKTKMKDFTKLKINLPVKRTVSCIEKMSQAKRTDIKAKIMGRNIWELGEFRRFQKFPSD